MTKIRIADLIWDQWNRKHIRRHSISEEEIAVALENVGAHRRGYSGRIILIGRSQTRIVSVILAKEQIGKYYIVTARDADKKERRLLYEKEQKKQNS